MYLIKNNGYWYKGWREDGKSFKKPLKDADGKTFKVVWRYGRDNREEAESLLKSNGQTPLEANHRTTVEDFIPEFLSYIKDKGAKTKTVQVYTQTVLKAKDHLPFYIQDITLEHINNYIDSLRFSQSTKVKYAKSLSRFFRVAKAKGKVREYPMEGFEYPAFKPDVHPYTEEQIQKILAAAKELATVSGEPYYVFTMFAFQTGLRLEEYANLDWKYLDLTGGTYSIVKTASFDPKHSHHRIVKIPQMSLQLLISLGVKKEGLIFPNQFGRKYTHFARDFSNAVFKAAGVEGDLHQIRKTMASYRLGCGQPIQNLMAHLGHNSLKELQYYLGLIVNPSPEMRKIFGDF